MESYNGAVLSPNDALILLEAARQRLIPKITRRLKDHERQLIKPGSIFIWDEKEAKMRRWTDGRSWSASRVTGAFLTYREMEATSNSSPSPDYEGFGGKTSPIMDSSSADFRYKPDGLIKQSFSLTTLKGDKLHLISYTTAKDFSTSKFLNKTPSNDAVLKDIKIPKDIYPQHAFLDSKSDESVYNKGNVSPLSSPNYPSQSYNQQEQQKVSQQQVQQPPSQYQQSLSAPMSTSSSIQSNVSSASDLIIPRSSIKLPPLNKTNIMRVDYDGRALNALDRLSFNY